MTTPVPLFQHMPELEQLLGLYRKRKPRRVLEVGTYHGGTLYHWLQNAPAGATVVSVDSYRAGVDNRALYKTWLPADRLVQVVAVEGDSRDEETLRQTRFLGPYDWIFIDAGHYLDEVTADWDNYRPQAAAGAILAFHDILPATEAHPEIEVSLLWEQIKRDYETVEIVHDRNASWGGIGVVYL